MAFNDKKLVYALRHSPETFGLNPTKYEDTTPARLLGNLKRMYEWKASGKNIKKV